MFNNDRVRRIDTPIQIAGQDEILTEWEFGGPTCMRDVRLIMDVDTLGHLLDVARSSMSRRVIINRAGFRVKLRRARTGHCYETLHVSGLQPTPEVMPQSIKVPISLSHAEVLIERSKKK